MTHKYSMKLKLSLALYVLMPFIYAQAEQPLTVYSYRHYESDDALFTMFTEQSGIQVNVVKTKADTLLERIKAEGDQSPADILLTSDVGRLHMAKAEGILQPTQSSVLQERIPSHLRDPENHWFGFTQRARVIVYAPDRVKASELSTYEALAAPEWRGRLLIRSSSNIYNQSFLASMIHAQGEAAALAWATQIRKNMARSPQGSDRDQMRAVFKGLADVALVNTYYVGLLQNSDNPKDREVGHGLKIFFPNQGAQGTHINVSGAGIVSSAKNINAAVAFLEFLASDTAQQTFPATTYEYPVVAGIPWSSQQKAWGDFKADTVNLEQLGKHNSQAVRLFNTAGWE